MLDLKTQRTPASFAHFLKLRPLFFGHADIELARFFLTPFKFARQNF